MLSIIEVSDPDVSNLLVDLCGIESIILIAKMDEALNVMGKNPPMNVKSVRRERESGVGETREREYFILDQRR